MLNTFQWVCLLSILAATFAGGYYPLFHQEKARSTHGFPLGEAFTAGVFLALALLLMMPSSLHLLGQSFPGFDFPWGALIAAAAFLGLLALEHKINELRQSLSIDEAQLSRPMIPIIMTIMIAVPSFFLGTAFGVSGTGTALLIFVAIMVHKSSAAFALSLEMVRSTMTRRQVWTTFSLFAFSTPLGILVGQEIHNWLGAAVMMTVKGTILGLAAGTFLFLATLHELHGAPMISKCKSRLGFSVMQTATALSAIVSPTVTLRDLV